MPLSALVLMTCAVLAAAPKSTLYASPHPVPHSSGGSYCYLAASHEHPYGPESSSDFQRHRDHWVFVGDPSSVGAYKGPLFRYQDAHPVPHDVSFAPVEEPFQAQCRRAGMHQHAWEPLPSAPFTFRGGVFRFQADHSAGQLAAGGVSHHPKQQAQAKQQAQPERVEVGKKTADDATARSREQGATPLRQAPADARVVVSARVFAPVGTHRVLPHSKARKEKKKSAKHHRKHHDDDDDEHEEDDDEDDDD